MNVDIVGGVFGMRPPQDSVGGGMEDVLGVGSGEVESKGDVERVMNRGVGSLGRGDGLA